MQDIATYQSWMDQAIALAKLAGTAGEIPVGAIVVNAQGEAIGLGANYKERSQDPTAHAEIIAIREAAKNLRDWHLTGCTLYVTLEPCPMCAGAIVQSRLSTVVYGADDPKTGAIRTVINLSDSPASLHRLEAIAGIREQECQELLRSWFEQLRMSH